MSWKRVENVSLIKETAGRAFLEKYDYKERNFSELWVLLEIHSHWFVKLPVLRQRQSGMTQWPAWMFVCSRTGESAHRAQQYSSMITTCKACSFGSGTASKDFLGYLVLSLWLFFTGVWKNPFLRNVCAESFFPVRAL